MIHMISSARVSTHSFTTICLYCASDPCCCRDLYTCIYIIYIYIHIYTVIPPELSASVWGLKLLVYEALS